MEKASFVYKKRLTFEYEMLRQTQQKKSKAELFYKRIFISLIFSVYIRSRFFLTKKVVLDFDPLWFTFEHKTLAYCKEEIS